MASTTPTTQWTRTDEPILGALSPAYLEEDANGVIGLTTDAVDATHQLAADAADGVMGVEAFVSGESQMIDRNNAILLVRVKET